ncbi:ABC transporter substrate-binding protein [Herbaspirillum sp. alder98]|uniref:ABC transporter substrate-binding protein n=1 Tax=Herbaspirillum sp. alder98 TaxID=2913096 RepID=UPI001CD855DA|nr:sulfonate ABC transporter substrate-binding protein [Herbaspirillum sp. alder98]MCA1325569.1 sulfonate ABC transporter substrate-binding protein [Herbaspirillum sp. alder98]
MRTTDKNKTTRHWIAGVTAALAATTLLWTTPAQAEGQLRIAYQYDVGDILLHVVRDQKLIEKYAAQEGVQANVEWKQLSGGAAINDAILSNTLDVASTGLPPLLTIWDRTYGKQNIKAIAALGSLPTYLLTRNPDVKKLTDFSPRDRIALPATTISLHARLLQIAAAQQFGKDKFAHFDEITVTLPHSEAAAALLSGKTEVNSHFASPPFQFQELKDPAIRKITTSYEILGGPSTLNILWAPERYQRENPKTFTALRRALAEALVFVQKNKAEAAAIYVRLENSRLPVSFVQEIISSPDVQYTLQPQNTFKLASFLADVGAIKHRPASWKDYFFDEAQAGGGS